MTQLLKAIFTAGFIIINFSLIGQVLWEKEVFSSFNSERQMATSESGEIIIIDRFTMTKISADGEILLEKDLSNEDINYNFFSAFIFDEFIYHISPDRFSGGFLWKYDFDGNLVDKIDVANEELLVTSMVAIDEENFVGIIDGSITSTSNDGFIIYNIHEGIIFEELGSFVGIQNDTVFVEYVGYIAVIALDRESRSALFQGEFPICEGESLKWLTDEGDVACRQLDAEFGGGDFYSVYNSNGLILQTNRRTVNDLYRIGSTQLAEWEFGQISNDCHYGIQSNVEQIEVFYGDPDDKMSNIVFDKPGRVRDIFVTPNELGGLNIGIENNNGFQVYKLDMICGARPPQSVSTSTGQYATFSGGLEGTGVFSCDKMPNFTYSISGDIAPGDTSVPGPQQMMDNNGGGFESIFGEADLQQNIEIEVDAYFGEAGDPISKEVLTTLDFDFPVPKGRLGFVIADVEQDQVQISALDINGEPVRNSVISRWLKETFDADIQDQRTDAPNWDPISATLVGHLASDRQRQTVYQEDLPDDEAGAAWFVVDIPITQLKFTSQALGIAPDDPSMHFFFASNCADEDVSFNFSSRPIIGPLRIGDVYAIDVETCNTGETDLFNLEVRSDSETGINELEGGNTSFDLPADSCIVSFYGYEVQKNVSRSGFDHDYTLFINEREIISLDMDIEIDLSDLITEPISDLPYLELYPWLSGRISEEDCSNLEIIEYDFGRTKKIYLSDGRLFFGNGTLECQSSATFNCIGFSDYTEDKIANRWNCIDGTQVGSDIPDDTSESPDSYPWIANISSSFDCNTLSILEYDQGAFSYLFVSDKDKSQLYFEDGSLYCTDSETRDCRQLYHLSESQITGQFGCGGNVESENETETEGDETQTETENENEGIISIDSYPWIENVVQSFSCSQVTVLEYDLGAFTFIYINDGNRSELYFQDGTFYCAESETRDCRALYNLSESNLTNRWSCDGSGNDSENESDAEDQGDNSDESENKNALFSEFPWINDVISPDCTTGSVTEYRSGIFSFFLIDNGNQTALYFEDGTFYCTDTESYDCVAVYGLGESIRSFSCSASDIHQSNGRSFVRDTDYLSASISPNPSYNMYHIIHPVQTSQILIFDITGKLLFKKDVFDSSHTTVDLSDFEAGVYLMNMRIGDQIVSEKLVKL